MLRVVIDPNVFVSAVITPDGVPAQIVRAALKREFHLVVSTGLIGELVDVFAGPQLRQYIDGEQAQTLIDGILGVAELRNDPPPSHTDIRDPNDAYLCALADAEGAAVLVSGDRDLFAVTLVSAAVLTPRAFLDKLRV